MRDVGRNRARHCCIPGDFNIELGLLFTGDEGDEELAELSGPSCWQEYGADPGGFKKLMWHSVMKEMLLQSHVYMAKRR